MRLCHHSRKVFARVGWQDSDIDGDSERELCLVCVKGQTLQAWDSSQQDMHFLSGCYQLALLCSSVKLYRLETSGFSSAMCTQNREQCELK